MDDEQRRATGMCIRREVLGSAHVDRAEAARTEFTSPFQDFITRYAWGEIWERPGLSRRDRSLVTLALMIALNREDEYRMHLRAALNNGVTQEEIQEVLLHCGVYCGLPAANAAFAVASEFFAGQNPPAPNTP
jgi:4-carboxymuconolactone decarboxylase